MDEDKQMLKRLLLVFALLSLSACGGGGGGGSSGNSTIAAPSGLSYPTMQALTVGQQMSSATPTVSGTVGSYSISPALPAGLSLDANTGIISGTPTATAVSATYTVTASNSGGSTTAGVTFAVNDAPPVPLYPKTTLKFMKGVPVTAITPTNGGGPNVVWSIHPTLPPGLTFDISSGSIGGTPTDVSSAAPYVVTAQNSGGDVTANLTVSVESGVLFDMGHTDVVTTLRRNSTRVLSHDDEDHWVLWDANTRASIASGNADCVSRCVELVGSTAIISRSTGFDIREAADGALRASIETTPSWWSIPSDASYIVSGDATGVTAWSTTNGSQLWTRAGNYANAVAFADLTEIRLGRSPAGAQVIETLAVADGASTVSPTFLGTFFAWFTDGGRFLTTASTTVRVYSAGAALEDLKSLSTLSNLAGQGAFFYSYDGTSTLDIYEVGNSGAPAASFSLPLGVSPFPQGLRLVLAFTSTPQISIIDLSSATPTRTDHPLSEDPGLVAFADATHWVYSTTGGVIVDETTTPGTPVLFGYGAVEAVAGGATRVAVATKFGKILYFDVQSKTLEGEFDFPASRLELSDDGTILAAVETTLSSSTLKIFELPGEQELYSETFSGPNDLDAISLSSDGQVLTKVLSGPSYFEVTASPATGGTALWSITGNSLNMPSRIEISPDASLAALMTGDLVSGAANIYRDGALVGAANGMPVGWVDDARLMMNTYRWGSVANAIYESAHLVDEEGNVLHTLPDLVREVKYLQPVSGDRIYSFDRNAIYSLTTGETVWTGSVTIQNNTPYRRSSVAGDYVIFPSKGALRAEPY